MPATALSRRREEPSTSELSSPPAEPAAVIADTGIFVVCGRQTNNKYVALERSVHRNEQEFASFRYLSTI